MVYRHKRAFTLIELVMVITIIGILSVSGSWLVVYFVRNSVYIPNQLNADMVASDALKIMIEGDSQAKGLRFSRVINSIPSGYRITFTNQDGEGISYRLDTGANALYRSISGGSEARIPYYSTDNIGITGVGGALFTFYDANEAVSAVAANVRRVAINLAASTGSGLYSDWEGQSAQSSSIAVDKYQ